MMIAPQISPLEPFEYDRAVDLWHRAGLTRPWNDPMFDLRRAMVGPDSTVLAARSDDGHLIGTTMVGHDGHRSWVYYLAVDDAWRGRGIGRLLMKAAEAWTCRCDIPKLQFLVRSDNEQVLSFYEHLGYERQNVAVFGRRLDGTPPGP